MNTAIATAPPTITADTSAAEHTLSDGARVTLTPSAVEVRDDQGMLLVRYENGHAHVAAPAGDLLLSAPRGNVRIQAEDALHIASGRVDIRTQHADARADHVTLTAGRIATTASSHSVRAEHLEITALKLVERSRDTFRQASDLLQIQAGRVRTLVEQSYSLFSKRTAMQSKQETSIDGSKILLG